MTDKDIGKTVREIVDRGNTAEVRRNRDGIVILEISKRIAKSDRGSELTWAAAPFITS